MGRKMSEYKKKTGELSDSWKKICDESPEETYRKWKDDHDKKVAEMKKQQEAKMEKIRKEKEEKEDKENNKKDNEKNTEKPAVQTDVKKPENIVDPVPEAEIPKIKEEPKVEEKAQPSETTDTDKNQ